MSSSRRRSSASNGAATGASEPPAASASTSSSSTRRSHHRSSSSSSSSSKKRRYEDIVNRCRNPFCGATLENKHQRYCDASRMCQLYRGIVLNCAWPNAPRESDADADPRATRAAARGPSVAEAAAAPQVATDAPTAAGTAPRRSPTSAATSVDRNGDVAMIGGDKRPRTATPPPEETSTKRLKLSNTSSSGSNASGSASASAARPVAGSAAVTTTARQVKTAAIEVVPLGVGSRGGGGGRYVQSGNRATGAPLLPTPSVSTATSSDAPSSRAPSPLLPSPRGVLPPPGSSLIAASRVLSRANSLPVTTTNKNRDPRVRFAPIAAGSSGDTDAGSANGGLKLISAADYLNSRRNRATGSEAAASGGSSNPLTDETLLSSKPSNLHRPLERASSSSSVTSADPRRSGDMGHNLRGPRDAHATLRRAHSDNTTYEPTKTDRYSSHGQQDTYRDRSHASSSAVVDRSHADHHHDRSQHAQDRHPPSRASSSASATSSSHPRGSESAPAAASSHRSAPTPKLSRAEILFSSALRPTFSHCDPFLKLIITRMASFLPGTLGPVRNKTTKPRTQQWYIDRAKNVREYCGKLVMMDARNGAGSLTVAGRVWLSVTGTQTSTMYHELLEKALVESERWRDMIIEFRSMLDEDIRRLGVRAIPGVTFLKFWSAMKNRTAEKASDFEFQTSFIAGREHYHWTFVAGNVELGSGSDKDKLAAFKEAASSAAKFVKSLMILDDKEKRNVAREDARTVSDRPSSHSTRSSPDNRAGMESSRRSSRSTDHSTTGESTAVATSASAATALSTAPASGQATTSSSTSARELVVEVPAAAAAAVKEGVDQRQRSDSWTEPTDLAANFSPIVRSSSESESDTMSISEDEDQVTPAKSSASTSAAVAAPTTNPAVASPTPPGKVTAPAQASAPASAPTPTHVATASAAAAEHPPVAASVSSRAEPTPESAPVSTPRPTLTVPAAATTIPDGPTTVPVPLASPVCRFCVGIQATSTNPNAKCLRCQKNQPKAAVSKAASNTINSLHSILMQPMVFSAAFSRPPAASSSDSTASVNVVESLPSSTASTPRNGSKK